MKLLVVQFGLGHGLEELDLLGLPLGVDGGLVHRILRELDPVDLVLDGHPMDLCVRLLDLLDTVLVGLDPQLLLLVLLDVPLDPPEDEEHHEDDEPGDDQPVDELLLVFAEEVLLAVVFQAGWWVSRREEDGVDAISGDLEVELLSRRVPSGIARVLALDPFFQPKISPSEAEIVLLAGAFGLVDGQGQNHWEFVRNVLGLSRVI